MVSESTQEYDAGLSIFTWLDWRNPIASPFMPLLKPCDWSESTPSPYWLYGEFVPLWAFAAAAVANAIKSVIMFFLISLYVLRYIEVWR